MTMLKITIPVETGNRTVADGELTSAFEKLMADARTEAAYFMMLDGKRGALFFFETDDPTLIPRLHEPLLSTLDASIETIPVLSFEELRKGLG